MTRDASPHRITICIPTFNRKDVVNRRVDQFNEFNPGSTIQLLISDNRSEDGTFESLIQHGQLKNITIIQNLDHGSHFFGNIVNLFRSCTTQWAVYCSDEDWLSSNGIKDLENKISSAGPNTDIVIGSVSKGNSGIAGETRLMSDKPLLYREIANLTYVSGLVFNIQRMTVILNSICKLREEANNSFLFFFPHTAMLWAALARQGLVGMKETLILRQERAKGFFGDKNNKVPWKTVEGRWQIWLGAQEWLRHLKDSATEYGCDQGLLEKMEVEHSSRLIREIRQGINYESPAYNELFDKGIRQEAARFLAKGL